MKTTDLFDFPFADRANETIKFDKYMASEPDSVLWLDGYSGIGKKFFLKKSLQRYPQYQFINCVIHKDCPPDENLSGILDVVQKETEKTFPNELKNNYLEIINTYDKTSTAITSLLPASLRIIAALLLDTTNFFINNRKKKIEPSTVVSKYLLDAFAEKNIVFCVEGFSNCDNELVDFMIQVFNYLRENSLCYIIIITDKEYVGDETREFIHRSIPLTYLPIGKFDEHRYFFEILYPIFDLEGISDDDIKYIYTKCKGEPKRLSMLISILLEKDAIDYDSYSKAVIDKDILRKILKREHIRFSSNEFSTPQKIIIYSIVSLYNGVSIEIIKNLVIYLAAHIQLFSTIVEDIFYSNLQELVDKRFLKSDGVYIYYIDDSDYIEYVDMFHQSTIFSLFSKNVYEFLLMNPLNYNYNIILLSNMSNGNVTGWRQSVFDYGYKLYQSRDFYSAKKMFEKLYSCDDIFDDEQILVFALNEYEIGNFKKANEFFSQIDRLGLKKVSFCNYLYHYGKSVYNNSGKIDVAISYITEALEYTAGDLHTEAKIKNTLQMYWWESPQGFETAKSYFEDVKNNYKDSCPDVWASTIRGCHNYIFEKNEAMLMLEEGLKTTDEETEQAFIKTSMGYVCFRAGEKNNALQYFEESYDSIFPIKKHESIYPANDMAVCYMLKNTQEAFKYALDILEKSLYWNRTNYGRLVLQTHMMICHLYLNHHTECLYFAKELQRYLDEENPSDPVIIRKICVNLSIVYKSLNKSEAYERCKNALQGYVFNTSSEHRYKYIFEDSVSSSPINPYIGCCIFDPWLIVHAHD